MKFVDRKRELQRLADSLTNIKNNKSFLVLLHEKKRTIAE